MRRLAAAVMFLTRVPLPSRWRFEAVDVGRAAAFFPLVGAAIGAVQCGALAGALKISGWVGSRTGHLTASPAAVFAVLLVTLEAILTGALHLDGLADMADGFGGGRGRDDVLRIMRDHAIGSYGAVALILVLFLKIASLAVLIQHQIPYRFLTLAPALARGSIVALGFVLPYARPHEGGLGGSVQHIGKIEVLVSTSTSLALVLWLVGWRMGGAILVPVCIVSAYNAQVCRRRIQGVTGDTLGANVEVCEAVVLAAGAFLAS